MARTASHKQKLNKKNDDGNKKQRMPGTLVARVTTHDGANDALTGHELVDVDVDASGAAVMLLRRQKQPKSVKAARFSTALAANNVDYESVLKQAFCVRVGGREVTWVFYYPETSSAPEAEEGADR